MIKGIISSLIVTTFLLTGVTHAGGLIDDAVRHTLLSTLPWNPEEVEITDIALKGPEPLAFDSVRVNLPRRTPTVGHVTMYLNLLSHGSVVDSVWATADVKVFKEVVVAVSPLRINDLITPDDVKLARAEVRDSSRALTDTEDVIGMTVKRPVAAGSVIREDYIRPQTIIKRGDAVVLVVQGSSVTVRSNGTASEDGYKGGTITAVTKSGHELTGTVSAPGEVSVAFY